MHTQARGREPMLDMAERCCKIRTCVHVYAPNAVDFMCVSKSTVAGFNIFLFSDFIN